MDELEQLRERRRTVLAELEGLEEIRRGSVVEQYVEGTRRDGSRVRRGPYLLYSYKEKGKTVSRRVREGQEAARLREQIQRFRRFQQLTGELLALGERISELLLREAEGVKKTSTSRRRWSGTGR